MRDATCLLCGSGNYSLLLEQYGVDPILELIGIDSKHLSRGIVKCAECGFVFHSPTLSNEELCRLYDVYRNEEYRKESPDSYFDRLTGLSVSESFNFKKVKRIDDFLSRHKPDVFDGKRAYDYCDVGAGGGLLIYAMQNYSKYSWAACGVEPTPSYAAMASRRLDVDVKNSFFRRGLFDGKFNLMTAIKVLEHTDEPVRFLSDLAFDLDDVGVLYLEVPSVNEVYSLDQNHPQLGFDHLIFFSEDSLRYVAEKAGLKILYMEELKNPDGDIDLILFAEKHKPMCV